MTRGGFLRGAGAVVGGTIGAGLFGSGIARAQAPGSVVTVSNASELQEAIYNFETIYVAPGDYDLSSIGGTLYIADFLGPVVAQQIIGLSSNGQKPYLHATQNADIDENGNLIEPLPQAIFIYKPSGPLTLQNLEIEHNGWDALNCFGSNGFTINNCIL